MERKEFDFIKQILEVKEHGVKEACLMVKEYLNNLEDITKSAVTKEEFIEAITIILNYSFTSSNKNTVVKEYYCKEDCRMNTEFCFCKGEFSLSSNSKKLCKHYLDPNK